MLSAALSKLQKIYPLTDRSLTGLSHTEQLEALVKGGSRFLQLREKELASGPFLEDAVRAVRSAHAGDVIVLINDRADIALMAGADGVHLGQDDLPPAAARKILGTSAIIGLSTHNLEQVERALNEPIDYIAFGPVFSTATKKDTEPVTGLETLREARRLISGVPLIAIGGINVGNLGSVLGCGADSGAMISEVLLPAEEITANIERLLVNAEGVLYQ